ncbi:MAG TPA: NRDE family protein [Streptosporangiaceae bacterium]|jgi:uncharacterized protein with NRDE domain
MLVCLLIVMFQVSPAGPLVVAANRDERYARPATAITVLREAGPRMLGGLDQLAGGTWLAVNEHGVVAGLTNLPSPAGRDPARRSRGELPVALASWPDAAAAAGWLAGHVDPARYNPCWLLAGDRESLFYLDLTGAGGPVARQLPAGIHILENAPLLPPSVKARHVAGLLAAAGAATAADPAGPLAGVLRDHTPVPAGPGGSARAAGLSAACVHAGEYGTRSAMIVTVGPAGPPRVLVADGPPCTAPFTDVTALWDAPAG